MATASIRGLTIDVSDRDRAERFWGGLLGLTVTRRIDQYSYFDDAFEGMRLILQEVPDPRSPRIACTSICPATTPKPCSRR